MAATLSIRKVCHDAVTFTSPPDAGLGIIQREKMKTFIDDNAIRCYPLIKECNCPDSFVVSGSVRLRKNQKKEAYHGNHIKKYERTDHDALF